MKMKRWKVWVSFVFGIPHKVQFNQFDKTKTDYQCRFVQRLPGDVVLSREEAAALRALAEWEGDSNRPIDWTYGLPPKADCSMCLGKGTYTWESGHNGDEKESTCKCTRQVSLTVGRALASFRGRR